LTVHNQTEIYLNNSEVSIKNSEKNTFTLVCSYDDVLTNLNDQMKWYFNKMRLKSTLGPASALANTQLPEENSIRTSLQSQHHYTIIQKVSFDTNTTTSILHVHNFNSEVNAGKYKCQYKGLSKSVRVFSHSKEGK
jgi:hypothetical protein